MLMPRKCQARDFVNRRPETCKERESGVTQLDVIAQSQNMRKIVLD